MRAFPYHSGEQVLIQGKGRTRFGDPVFAAAVNALVARVREGHLRGMTTADAVADALKSTAGVVTSAAVVMVAVFSIFAVLPETMFKQLGVGLAAAVLIDATLVRAILLPAAMKLLGEWNWYLPPRPRFTFSSHPGRRALRRHA